MKNYTYTFNRLRETDENVRRRFMNLPYIEKNEGLSADLYYTEYNGVIEAEDEQDACELLYLRFNFFIPDDFTGYSMSVSDIIELWDNDGEEPIKTTWYCDNIGFVQLIDDAAGKYKRA